MKRILKNALGDVLTSALGAMAGLPEIVEGVSTHNNVLIIKGLGLFLLGLIADSNPKN